MKDTFIYDPTSPTCLSWKHTKVCEKSKRIIHSNGQHAGCLRFYKDGKARNSCVTVNGKSVYAHRVVWFLFYGEISTGCVVDHIDGNPHNNNISNLRVISSAENARNMKKMRTNSSGVTGVSYLESYNAWRAIWHDGAGNQKSKWFPISKYGDEAYELAVKHRTNMIHKLNKLGYNYSERHGK